MSTLAISDLQATNTLTDLSDLEMNSIIGGRHGNKSKTVTIINVIQLNLAINSFGNIQNNVALISVG